MYTAKLLDKKLLVADIWSFSFEIPRGFHWRGGEHTVVILNNTMLEGGDSRVLSIASLPSEKQIQVVTHCAENGSAFKKGLLNLLVGGAVTLTEPQPSFRGEFGSEPAVFLVGGIGIAAVRSLLMEQSQQRKTIKARMLYYAPSGQHIFTEDLNGLVNWHPELTVEYLVAEELKETGAIKEVERAAGINYYFSGVYTREMLAHNEIAGHIAGSEDEARKEVELLAKVGGLIK